MAISFISAASDASNPTTSFSVTLPATAADDILILEYLNGGATAAATLGGTYTGGAWTQKHSQTYNGAAEAGFLNWSRCTGNHTGETVTGTGLTNNTVAIVTVYRGALTSGDPLADATVVGEENASADETNAEITTTTNGAFVCLAVAQITSFPTVSSQSCTSPGALTERVEQASTGGNDCAISHASAEKATAGATGAFTWAQANAATGSWAYAITPAGAGATVGRPVLLGAAVHSLALGRLVQ